MLSHLNIATGETSQAMMHNIKESGPHQTAKKNANSCKHWQKVQEDFLRVFSSYSDLDLDRMFSKAKPQPVRSSEEIRQCKHWLKEVYP